MSGWAWLEERRLARMKEDLYVAQRCLTNEQVMANSTRTVYPSVMSRLAEQIARLQYRIEQIEESRRPISSPPEAPEQDRQDQQDTP